MREAIERSSAHAHRRRYAGVWVFLFTAVLAWSAYQPHDGVIWLLEAGPAVIAVAVLAITYRRFPLTPLLYWLILVHSVILMVGAHYTYAEVPAFDWLQEQWGLSRNYYDKVGHFAQGFVPAIAAREVLIRLSPLVPGRWLAFVVVSICLAISAAYELLEWMVALISESGAEAFLGTQGDEWDTQSDMAMALLGACLALVSCGAVHDRQLREVAAES